MSNKEYAEKLLEALKEKMWYREGLPSDGWAVEKILEVLDAVEQGAQEALLDDRQVFKMPEPKVVAHGHFVFDESQNE